ncbi:melanization protease 1-like [Calliphora vicina]|uniref:melanization protease 1-like n=1 Tax=Calliphora vicina TaxID=7373 RepID=UPI00325B5C63
MYLRCHNVIFIAICLASSTAYPKFNKDCNKLLINEQENIHLNSESNENVMKCLSITQSNSSETKEKLQLQKDTSSNNVFSNDDFLTLLNIGSTNNANAIDILHDAVKSKEDHENPINSQVTSTPNTPNVVTSTPNIVTSTPITPNIVTSSPDIPNIVTSTDNIPNIVTSTPNTSNIVTTTPETTTTDGNLPLSDILLSQLTNLSQDGGEEVTVGQKIEFKRSSLNSDTDMVNPAGIEILKNTSAICGSLYGKRISFANETTLMEFPWTALLLYNTKLRYHCGGSLITTKYVLTAAHCVSQEFYELSGVRLGEHDVTEERDCAKDLGGDDICATTIDVDVVKIIVHHAYSRLSFKNDIALLKLDNDYLGRSFYPICIPNPQTTYGSKSATVAGWGATEKTIRSAILLKADVPILDISKCREIYRYSVFNDSTEICGSGVNEVDVCKGDSGGALFYREYVNRREKYHQLGIVSLGVRSCGDSRFLPAVFTKVQGFYKWIENNLEY